MTTSNLLKVLKQTTMVLTTVTAVLSASIVALETYEGLRKRLNAAKDS